MHDSIAANASHFIKLDAFVIEWDSPLSIYFKVIEEDDTKKTEE